jgi:hypothetical protein
MDVVIMVQDLDLILLFQINQIKITVHGQILDIHIFIQIMLMVLNKHGRNFQEQHKHIILKQNNIKCINLYLND